MKHNLRKELTRKETMQFMDRRILRYGFIVSLLLIACLLPLRGESAQQNRHAVLIDPAHGGEDAGVGCGRRHMGTLEWREYGRVG